MDKKIKQDVSIGENLQRLRINAGLSQEEVAAKMQLLGFPISREMMSQMESGKYSIRISVLLAMKKLYHADSIDEFFKGLYD